MAAGEHEYQLDHTLGQSQPGIVEEKVDQKPRARCLVVGALWDVFSGAYGLWADFLVGDEDKVGSGQEGHHQVHWSFTLPSQMDLSFLSNLSFQALPGFGFRSLSP